MHDQKQPPAPLREHNPHRESPVLGDHIAFSGTLVLLRGITDRVAVIKRRWATSRDGCVRVDSTDFAELLSSPLTREHQDWWQARCEQHFGAAQSPEIAAFLDLIIAGTASTALADRDAVDRCYIDSIRSLLGSSPLRGGVGTPRPAERVQAIDERFDFFHGLRDERDWSLPRCMNFWVRSKIRPRRRLAIVTTIRNEGINLIEWIAHHRVLGVDDFIIYVNDNDDGSSALLNLLAEHGVIHVIWNRTAIGKDGSTDMFPIQAKCFGHAAEFLPEARDFEWLLFMDLDEFLVTKQVLTTPAVARPLDDLFTRLAAMPELPAAVAFNWKWFKSLCEYARRPGLNFERFQVWGGGNHVKTMARGDRCIAFTTSHMPSLVVGEIVLNGDLERVEQPSFMMPPRYRYGQINHYFSKSFEEFVAKHLRVWGDRGFGDFFRMGGNRGRGNLEAMPALWIERVRDEIGKLQNLPGVAAEIRKVEAAYAALLAAFDAENHIEALYDSYFVAS